MKIGVESCKKKALLVFWVNLVTLLLRYMDAVLHFGCLAASGRQLFSYHVPGNFILASGALGRGMERRKRQPVRVRTGALGDACLRTDAPGAGGCCGDAAQKARCQLGVLAAIGQCCLEMSVQGKVSAIDSCPCLEGLIDYFSSQMNYLHLLLQLHFWKEDITYCSWNLTIINITLLELSEHAWGGKIWPPCQISHCHMLWHWALPLTCARHCTAKHGSTAKALHFVATRLL